MLRRLFALLAVLALFSAPVHADFVVDGTSLPSTKVDLKGRPSTIPATSWFGAVDFNALMQASLDLRSAITGVTSNFALRLGNGATTAVSSAGTGAIRYSDTSHDLEQSANGTAWTPIPKFQVSTATFAAVDHVTLSWSNLGGTQSVFVGPPVVTDGLGGVTFYITGMTSTGATLNASAPWTGTVAVSVVSQ